MRAALLFSVAVLVVGSAAAAPLSPDVDTLYVYSGGELYLSHLTTPDSEILEIASNPLGSTTHTFVLPLAGGANNELGLEGQVNFNAHIGGGTSAGQLDVTYVLDVGGTEIARATVEGYLWASSYNDVPATADVQVSSMPPGKDITWTIVAEGVAPSLFIRTQGESWVQMPITGILGVLELPPQWINVTDEVFVASYDALEQVSTTRFANWTAAPSGATLALTANVVAGNAEVQVVDDDGGLVWNRKLTKDTIEEEAVNGTAGTWSLRIDMEAFEGSIEVTMTPLAVGGETGSSGEQNTGQPGSGAPSGTPGSGGVREELGSAPSGQTDEAPAESSPSLALGLLVLLVGSLAARRR